MKGLLLVRSRSTSRSASRWLGGKKNTTLHSADKRVFTGKVSRWLFQSEQDFCGQKRGSGWFSDGCKSTQQRQSCLCGECLRTCLKCMFTSSAFSLMSVEFFIFTWFTLCLHCTTKYTLFIVMYYITLPVMSRSIRWPPHAFSCGIKLYLKTHFS